MQFTYLKKRYFVIFCQTFLWSQKILLLTEVPVPSQESKRSCICMLGVSILPLSMIFLVIWKKTFFLMQRYWLERILLVLPVLKVGLELASHSGQYRWEHHWPERNTTIYMNYKKLKIIKKHHNKIDMVNEYFINKIM
jgi:hypothetical protein